MSLNYEVSDVRHVESNEMSLLVDAEEYVTDGAPNFWRVTLHPGTTNKDETVSGKISRMKCGELVELRLKDVVLWCHCSECGIVNIEDTHADLDDDEVE